MKEGRGRGGGRRDGAKFAVLARYTHEKNPFATEHPEQFTGILSAKVLRVEGAKRCHCLPVVQNHSVVVAT